MRWPIGAHWCQHAYAAARDLGLSFTWLHADGLSDDARSIALHDAAGLLDSGLRYVLTFSLRHEGLKPHGRFDRERWRAYVRMAHGRLREAGALGRCLAVQLDDEYYSHLHRVGARIVPASRIVAECALDVRLIFGRDVGAGVGMAETGGVLPPTSGIDWWGLNVYLAHGYYTSPGEVAAIYDAAARLGRPLMPILPVFADRGRPPLPLDALARCYLPLLERHAAAIFAVGIFALHHPSQYQDGHDEGRGVLELGQPYAAGVRYLTEVHGVG